MNGIPDPRAPAEPWERQTLHGWESYHRAIDLLEHDEWPSALRLLAVAETEFRTGDDHAGLWRALSGQAAAHWGAGDAPLAIARATAALLAAEADTDHEGFGLIAWQLAVMLLAQGDYQRAAELLLRAEQALDEIGAPPFAAEIGAAARLCVEIMRWHSMMIQGVVERRTATEVMLAIQRDLSARLAQAAGALRPPSALTADGSWPARAVLLPLKALPDQQPSRHARGSWLSRLWRSLTDSGPPPLPPLTAPAPMPAVTPRLAAPEPPSAPTVRPEQPPPAVMTPTASADVASPPPATFLAERGYAESPPTATTVPHAVTPPLATATPPAGVAGPPAETASEHAAAPPAAATAPDAVTPPPTAATAPASTTASEHAVAPPAAATAPASMTASEHAAAPPAAATAPASMTASEHAAAPPAAAPSPAPAGSDEQQPGSWTDAPTPPARPRAVPAEARIAVTCFGSFRVTIDDQPVERWESVRARTIFKYLVVRSPAPVSKELLAELFWPESEPDLARRSLHQAIYCLRQSLKRVAPDLVVIRYTDGCYQISPEARLWVDSEAFMRLIGEARAAVATGDQEGAMVAYATAADLMRGTFLEEERYEAWAEELRHTYRAMYSEALHRLARHYLGRGEHATAVLHAQRILYQEPCDEEAHLFLMRSYIAQGLRHLAVRQYQICANALRTELGLTPSPEIERFYRQVLASE